MNLLLIIFLFSIRLFATPVCDLRSELIYDQKSGQAFSSPHSISERNFNSIVNALKREFTNDFRSHGQQFLIEHNWQNNEENAFASQNGNQALIHMLGGYARAMNEDAFLMVGCHEIGHHLAGAPHYSGSNMSTEGQSDYFATSQCMRRMLRHQDNKTFIQRHGAHYSVRFDCNRAWGVDTADSYLCMRSIMAAMNLRLRKFPNQREMLNSKDYSVVGSTYERHPAPQCRFDTHRAGALCPMSEGSGRANCLAGRVRENSGARPRCWYAN